MISRTLRLSLAAFFVAGSALAADGSSALDRIERAYADGRIDEPTRALLGFQLVRTPSSLPEEFRPAIGEAPIRCGTELIRRAHVAYKRGHLSPEQAAAYAAGSGRPNMPNSLAVMDQGGVTQIATIHYGNNVTLASAQEIAGYLTDSWNQEITVMGWRAPPSDFGGGGADPGNEYDFYLDPTLGYAYTQPTQDNGPESWNDSPSYIVLDNELFNVETYVAHELNHASQFAYDYADGDFVYEATATWMEDKVYDSVNDYTYFIQDFQVRPEETLSFATYNNNYMYGGAVFFHYLSDVYDNGGTTVVRDVWDGLKSGNNDWFDGVNSALNGEGFSGIDEVYEEFAGIRLLTKSRGDGTFDEENHFDNVPIEASFDFENLENGSTSSPMMGMGANYILVTSSGAEDGDELTIRIKSEDEGPWAITVVGMPASGSASLSFFRDEDADGEVEATVANVTDFSQIGFAIVNTSNANEGVDSSFGGGVTREPHDFSWSFAGVGGGKDPVGCGCTIPGGRRSPTKASVIGAFLLATGAILSRRRLG